MLALFSLFLEIKSLVVFMFRPAGLQHTCLVLGPLLRGVSHPRSLFREGERYRLEAA